MSELNRMAALRRQCIYCGRLMTNKDMDDGHSEVTDCSVRYGHKLCHENRKQSDDLLFWSKVSKGAPDECWLWTGASNPRGYGSCWHNKQVMSAHRVAYILNVGEIPHRQFVCHKCDNPRCVNPSHLFLGTHKDNMTDMVRKRRHQHGERHQKTNLTENQVLAIRSRYTGAVGERSRLAKEFGVSYSSITKIVKREVWTHI